MTKLDKNETDKFIQENPHLKDYLNSISKKMDEPTFFSPLPMEARDEKFPNLIYPTKGMVFIHILRTPDMDSPEYKSIEPGLSEIDKIKHEQILKLIVKRAPEKKSVITDNDLKEIITELLGEITVIDEGANKIEKNKKKDSDKLIFKTGKVKVTSNQKKKLEYYIIKDLVGGGPIECFMRDPYIEDIHVIAGEKIHLVHKVFGMIKTNIGIAARLRSCKLLYAASANIGR